MNKADVVLAISSIVLVLGHVVPSAPAIRGRLVAALGERLFAAVYSLFAIVVLLWTVWAYRQTAFEPLWTPGLLRYLPLPVMPFAFVLLVGGLLSLNPTRYGSGELLRQGPVATGVLRITRHPFLWAVNLWSLVHILARGDLASTLFFGGYFGLGAVGSVALDRKYAARYGEDWSRFSGQTSNVPMMAILAGRTHFPWREIRWPTPVAGLVLYGVVLAAHSWLFGVRPW